MMGLPLRVYDSEAKIYPLFSLYDFNEIENTKTFMIGTTNQMVVTNAKLKIDCVVNIDTQKITFAHEVTEKTIKMSKEEKYIYNSILNKVKNNFDDKNENWMLNMNSFEPNFEGSDDYIRNEIKNYFYDFFIDLSLAIQVANSTNDDKNNFYLAILNNKKDDDADSTDEENEDNVNRKNSRLSEKEKKEQNRKIDRAIKKILKNYNVEFLCRWSKTNNFKIWKASHDKNICLRSNLIKTANNVNVLYDNGDTYQGSLCGGKKNGFGILTELSTSSIYNGNWLDDMKNGQGCLTAQDNKYIYDGEWKDNKKSGQGQLINHSIKYSGFFLNDSYHGPGILCDNQGNIYEGDFENNLFCGMGHYKAYNGCVYVGKFKNHKYHGKGQLTQQDGTIYNGFFLNGSKHGEGLILFPNGDKYEGSFVNDEFEGEGEYTHSDGRIDSGIWKKGIMKESY